MSDECAAAVPLSGGGGLERRVGRVAIRYLYLDGLAYSDLETSDRKAYGKERRPSVRRSESVARAVGGGGGDVRELALVVYDDSCELRNGLCTSVTRSSRSSRHGFDDAYSYLVDPASSHMLVSKIKPCMSKHKLLHSEAANGSLGHP